MLSAVLISCFASGAIVPFTAVMPRPIPFATADKLPERQG